MNVSTLYSGARAPLVTGVAMIAVLALSGCMGSPRYGTDKTANEQLVEDLTSVLSLAPKQRGENIEYKPRPELVKPETTAVLPPPQDSVTTASAAWPESPEQRRARIRKEAGENQDNPLYRSPVVNDIRQPQQHADLTPQEQAAEFKRLRAIQKASDPTTRRYLSEPPVTYRQAAATAPVDELGEDEWKKERAARRAARKPGQRSWWPW